MHRGLPAPTPETLMRSRYSAYAAGLVHYLVQTTDPEGPHWQNDTEEWIEALIQHCRTTHFHALTIIDSATNGTDGFVHFEAELSVNQMPEGFGEKSRFTCKNGRWLYHSGDTYPLTFRVDA